MMVMRRLGTAGCLVLVVALSLGCQAKMRVSEKSMEPTIGSGDLVRIDEAAYQTTLPQGGDIVALVAPAGAKSGSCGVPPKPHSPCHRPSPSLSDVRMVKRILAGPGQRIAIGARGQAIVDGKTVDEPYLQPCPRGCALRRSIRVAPGHWFVLGDNRPYSSDSRHWGPVPTRAIEGRVQPAQPLD